MMDCGVPRRIVGGGCPHQDEESNGILTLVRDLPRPFG